ADVDVHIFVPAVLADHHPSIDLDDRADKHGAPFLGHKDGIAGAGAVFVCDEGPVCRDHEVTLLHRFVCDENMVHDNGAPSLGDQEVFEPHDASGGNMVFQMHFARAGVGMDQPHVAQLTAAFTEFFDDGSL